ncbi:MAG: cobalamin-dependent protein [Bacteroidetes bacterium]|jgi:methanogenic corrinoid protein MtbC1|nr:cobalamin-dependent protein [Bacteroidota bacterium]
MIDNTIYENYFNSLIKGARYECIAIVDNLIKQNVAVDEIYTHLFQRALYQVGEYWEMNKISVATEHMATALTETLMIRMQPKLFSTERKGKKSVIACIANEYHQVGAKMIADIFEMNGWDGYFVGANTPLSELIRFIDEQKPDVTGLSLSLYFNLPELTKTLDQLQNAFPDMPILVGGQAFRWGGTEIIDQFKNVELMSDIRTLQKFINQN